MRNEQIERCCEYLRGLQIEFERFDHPPVFTVEEGRELLAHIPGAGTKNLFLRDKSGRNHILVTVPEEKRVDLKKFADTLEFGRLSFASAERLMRLLGVEPGSVTLLGLINDTEQKVQFIIDNELVSQDRLQMHPLTNCATLVIKTGDVEAFVMASGHTWNIHEIPELGAE